MRFEMTRSIFFALILWTNFHFIINEKVEVFASPGDTVTFACGLPPNPIPHWLINEKTQSRHDLFELGYVYNLRRELELSNVTLLHNGDLYRCFNPLNISEMGVLHILRVTIAGIPTTPNITTNGSILCFEAHANPLYPITNYSVEVLLSTTESTYVILLSQVYDSCQCIDLLLSTNLKSSEYCQLLGFNLTAGNVNGSSNFYGYGSFYNGTLSSCQNDVIEDCCPENTSSAIDDAERPTTEPTLTIEGFMGWIPTFASSVAALIVLILLISFIIFIFCEIRKRRNRKEQIKIEEPDL